MKELWLMCKSSLYNNFIDQNEQRINDGEIDLMLFPSEVFPFNSCSLPLDLNNKEELIFCICSGYGQHDRLYDLFKELADLNTDQYDKIGIYIDNSANDFMFGNMIHYFIDTRIFVKTTIDGKEHMLSADTIECAQENYRAYASENNSLCMFDGDNMEIVPNVGIMIVLAAVIDEEYGSVEKAVKVFKEKYDECDNLHPLYIASLMRAIIYNGILKGRIDGVEYTQETIANSDIHSFYQSAEVRYLNSYEEKEILNAIKKEKGKKALKKTA